MTELAASIVGWVEGAVGRMRVSRRSGRCRRGRSRCTNSWFNPGTALIIVSCFVGTRTRSIWASIPSTIRRTKLGRCGSSREPTSRRRASMRPIWSRRSAMCPPSSSRGYPGRRRTRRMSMRTSPRRRRSSFASTIWHRTVRRACPTTSRTPSVTASTFGRPRGPADRVCGSECSRCSTRSRRTRAPASSIATTPRGTRSPKGTAS